MKLLPKKPDSFVERNRKRPVYWVILKAEKLTNFHETSELVWIDIDWLQHNLMAT